MSEETVPREIFIYKLKIAAMLHDPPDKAWHVMGRKKMGHEEVSKRIIRELGLELGDICTNRASIADCIAAAADRWFAEIFSVLVSPHPQKIVLVNPFSLRSKEPVEPDDEYPHRWVKEIENIKNHIWSYDLPEEEKYKWFYYLLYAFGEPLYYKCYPCSISPADTRVPHHTVFDHLSVTATLSNWFTVSEEPRGLLVQIELAGVQKYIECSRKLCDMWFSSFFCSYLVWSLVEELVERLGPDILLSPSCRWNPFYFRWLQKRIAELNLEFTQSLTDLLEKLDILMLKKPMSILPTSVRLVLPPFEVLGEMKIAESESELAEYFVRRYKEAYGKLVQLVREKCHENEKIKQALEQVSGIPPLALRCAIVRVPEEVGEEAEKCFKKLLEYEDLKRTKTDLKEKIGKSDFYPFVALRKLACKFHKSEETKSKALLAVDFQRQTEELWRSRKNFTYCTVCGEVPSVFRVEPGEEIPGWIFDEGEHLCQYCLVKRLAATKAREEFLKWTMGMESKISTPTVDWQAIYPLIENLTDKEKGPELAQKLKEKYEKLEPLQKILKGEFEKAGARRPYVGGGKDAIPEILRILEPQDIENLLSEDIGGKYFALIQADADNMGCLLRGELGKIRGLPKEEDFFVEIVSKTGEYEKEKLDKFRKFASLWLRSMREVDDRETKRDEEETQKLWPSLLSAISRTLMLSALQDAKKAMDTAPEACTVVYAGGDDLLVIAPVPYALELVRETRKHFSEGDDGTFISIKLGESKIAFLPTLGNSSRSYSVIISHYRTPLSLTLERAREGLEEAKSTETISPNMELEKDSLFLEYRSRGGAGVHVVLPISPEHLEYLGTVKKLLNLIEDEKLSNSFIYDLMRICEKYDMAGTIDCPEIGSLVFDVWKRNVAEKELKTFEKFSGVLGTERVLNAAKVRLKPKRQERMTGRDEEHSLLLAISRTLRIISVGRRGIE
jgi:CRISPR-associated protein Cmr2